MKKYLLIIMILLFIPINAFAEVCEPSKISISSIELEDIKGVAEEKEEASINGSKINLNLKMSEVGDKAIYKMVVNNNSDEDYLLDESNFKVSSDYLEYDIETEDGSNVVESKTRKNIHLRVEYKNSIPNSSYNDTKTIDVAVTKNDVVESTPTPTANPEPIPKSTDDVKVPDTGTMSKTFLIVGVLALSFVGIYFIKNKYGKCMVLLLGICSLLLISKYSFALVTCSISVDSNVSIVTPSAMFKTGQEVNTKMKQFVNPIVAYSSQDTIITNIARYTGTPDSNNLIDANIVSTDDSMVPIYMWYDSANTTIYWYTTATDIYYNYDSSFLYYKLMAVNSISNMSDIRSDQTTNMAKMFCYTGYNSTSFTLDLGDKFDTSNVTDMKAMFAYTGSRSSIFTLDLGDKFDTSNVTNMWEMFSNTGYSNTSFTLDLGDKFDTSKVTDMRQMFSNTGYSSTVFTLNLGDLFDTSNVTSMSIMFSGTGYSSSVFTLDLGSKFDTSNVTEMTRMFNETGYSNISFALDLGPLFNTSKVREMAYMFSNFKGTTIYAPTTFVASPAARYTCMFEGCTNLVGGQGTVFNPSNIIYTYAHIDGGTSNPGYFTERPQPS